MKIETVKVFPGHFVELAIDKETNVYLLGVLGSHGCAGGMRYYEITQLEFESCLKDEQMLGAFGQDWIIHGSGKLYWSDFAHDRQYLKN